MKPNPFPQEPGQVVGRIEFAPQHVHDQKEEVQRLYHELLFAVSKKYPGETRHQTALRYIRNAEQTKDNRACSSQKSQ